MPALRFNLSLKCMRRLSYNSMLLISFVSVVRSSKPKSYGTIFKIINLYLILLGRLVTAAVIGDRYRIYTFQPLGSGRDVPFQIHSNNAVAMNILQKKNKT